MTINIIPYFEPDAALNAIRAVSNIPFAKVGSVQVTPMVVLGEYLLGGSKKVSGLLTPHSEILTRIGGMVRTEDSGLIVEAYKACGKGDEGYRVVSRYGGINLYTPIGVLFAALCSPEPVCQSIREKLGITERFRYSTLANQLTALPDRTITIRGIAEVKVSSMNGSKPAELKPVEVQQLLPVVEVKPAVVPPTRQGVVYVDASVREADASTVIVAYAPDLQECVIRQFPLIINSNDAEAEAIRLGWEAYGKTYGKRFTVLTDSRMCADQWASRLNGSKQEFSIQGRLPALGMLPINMVSIVSIPREQNVIADWLSKQGHIKFYSGRWKVLSVNGRLSIQMTPPAEYDQISNGLNMLDEQIQTVRRTIASLEAQIVQAKDAESNLRQKREALAAATQVLKDLALMQQKQTASLSN